MITVKELQDWLGRLYQDSRVGVDEGGLTLVEIAAEGHRTDAYPEVGGAPRGIDGDSATTTY